MKHFSHPHALKLSEYLKKEDDNDDETICSGCEQQLSSDSPFYTCPKRDCEFYLHKSCFELPKNIQHKSHPDHNLTLLSEPPQYSLYYDCNACGSLINAFSFHCEKCDFRLHVKCAFLPESVDCKAHEHALAVRYHTPKSTKDDDFDIVLCDVCDGCVTEGYWSYFCKDCDFVTDLECAFAADAAAPVEEEEKNEEDEDEEGSEELSDAMKLHIANIKAMDQMAKLQFQMQMAQLNARTKAMLFRSNV
ncbi:hypothetical protein DH2020_002700 [Rehmannia glutinosa]|uniref:Phorbol-ester/DAG-type domain-containing protein n=1 Tax=Rehmannia glutinosa TaxID=99300 RepID=A0ABR0XUJ4_REHGL